MRTSAGPRTTARAATIATALAIATPAAAGTVTGTISHAGKPAANTLAVTHDHATCGKSIASESLVVNADGELANAVVVVEVASANAATREPPRTTAVLDQKGCVFVPHVLAVGKRSRLEIRNSDAVLHNVHGVYEGTGRAAFNIAMPKPDSSTHVTLKKPGVIRLQCDAGHTWMRAYVHVLDHPWFAVTGADGSFRIDGVPPGTHRVVARHETLGEVSGTVTVTATGAAKVALSFPSKRPPKSAN